MLSQSEDEDDCSTVVKTSVTVDNSPIQDYVHLGDHAQLIYNSILFDYFFFSDKVMLLQLWRRKCTFLEAAVEVVLVGSTVTPLVIQFT